MTADRTMSGLLTIDVAAELRKLTEGVLEGPWQIPAELVRRALAGGAGSVDVALGRRGVVVRDDGRALPESLGEALAVVLDAARPDAERHAGLVALEAAGAVAPLALLAAAPARIVVETGDGARGWRLGAPRGERPILETLVAPAGTRIAFEGVGLDRARAREALGALCRFAPGTIRLEGEDVPRGFGPTLAEAPLDRPLAGRLALVAGDDVARVWLLLDGVVGAHLTLPSAPAFGACVEMRSVVAGPAGAAALRDAVAPHLASLVDQAVRLAIASARGLAERLETEQRQLRSFLLVAARRRLRTADVLRVPAFRALTGPDGRDERWLSLLELGREAADPERALWAVASGHERLALPSGVPVFVLAADERGRLADLLGVSFRTPPERREPSLGKRLGAALAGWRTALGRASGGLFAFGRRPVPDHVLSPDERALARALGTALPVGPAPTAVRFCSGDGPARRSRSTFWLPRENPRVVAAVRAVARDPGWLYPATLTLLAGGGLPGAEARRRWLAPRERGSLA